MSSWDKRGIPNPGSKEAVQQGCWCAVMDNHYGRGMTAGYGTPDEPAFWITDGCPLHSPSPPGSGEAAASGDERSRS